MLFVVEWTATATPNVGSKGGERCIERRERAENDPRQAGHSTGADHERFRRDFPHDIQTKQRRTVVERQLEDESVASVQTRPECERSQHRSQKYILPKANTFAVTIPTLSF